ncbi:hypothetical protein HKD37_04G010510 [Glycine soja]
MIFHSPPLQTPTQTLTPSPPPITTGGHHESSLFATKPPHGKEHFNQSEILKIYLKDSVENMLPIFSFVVPLR